MSGNAQAYFREQFRQPEDRYAIRVRLILLYLAKEWRSHSPEARYNIKKLIKIPAKMQMMSANMNGNFGPDGLGAAERTGGLA